MSEEELEYYRPKKIHGRGGPPLFYPGDEIVVGSKKGSTPKRYRGLVGQVIGISERRPPHYDLPGYTVYFPELDRTIEHVNPSSFELASEPQHVTRFPDTKTRIANRVVEELVEETIGRDLDRLTKSQLKQAYLSEIASKFSKRDISSALEDEWLRTSYEASSRPTEARFRSIYGTDRPEDRYSWPVYLELKES